MKLKALLLLVAATTLLGACDSNDESNPDTLRISLSNVDPLTNGFHFESWLIVNGSAVSAGKFNVDESGSLVSMTGAPISQGEFDIDSEMSNASAYVLTIEPAGDTDAIPSATHYLSGGINGGSGSLTVAHSSSLGTDFSSASGEYILATPTNGPDTDENSGIWFLENSTGSALAGLSLPALPDGWAYEGWAVVNGVPITSGTFLTADGVDDFDGFSGTQGGPPFPGEDFLVNAPAGTSFPFDIAGGKAVISIEPSPDSDPAPFTLKPLVGDVPVGAADHTVYNMGNNSAGFPTGSVVIN